jgi:tetratricopeptide (TPR) repeat protein
MKNQLLFLFTITLCAACNTPKTEQQIYLEKIQAADAAIQAAAQTGAAYNDTLAQQTIETFQQYAFRYPDDTAQAALCLFKAADLMKTTGEPQTVVSTYKTIIEKYPTFDKIQACYFLKADAYHNIIKNYPKATDAYTEYLTKYPQGTFAKDTKVLLQACAKQLTTEAYFEQQILTKK